MSFTTAVPSSGGHQTPQDQRLYLNSDSHAVLASGLVPEAVLSTLRYRDGSLPPVSGAVHSGTGYAALATSTHVYVWDYRQTERSVGPSTLMAQPSVPYYTFPLAVVRRTQLPGLDPTPLICLVADELAPTTAMQDVGLLACARDGQLRFWSHVAYGLGGVEAYQHACLPLDAQDFVQDIAAFDTIGYIVSTRQGKLFQISLYSDAGKPALYYRLLSKPMGVFQRVASSLLDYVHHVVEDNNGGISEPWAVLAMVTGVVAEYRQSRELFVLTRRYLQRWSVSKTYGEQFHFQLDVFDPIVRALAHHRRAEESQLSSLRVQLVDFILTPDNRWFVLASYCSNAKSKHLSTSLEIRFALFEIQKQTDPQSQHGEQTIKVTSIRSLGYTLTETVEQGVPRPSPKLVLLQQNTVFALIFSHVVVLSTLLSTSRFEECLVLPQHRVLNYSTELTLRTQSKSAVFRSSVSAVPWLTTGPDGIGQLTLLYLTGGVMDVYVNLQTIHHQVESNVRAKTLSSGGEPSQGKPVASPDEKQARKILQTKTVLEQAVFFGTGTTNPLYFSVGQVPNAVLETAASTLDEELMCSQSPHIRNVLELRIQLQERLIRTQNLGYFLHDQGLMTRLPSLVRNRLCWDGQKLKVALALWVYRDSLTSRSVDSSTVHPALQLLTNAAEQITHTTRTANSAATKDKKRARSSLNSEWSDDPLRHFFYYHVGQIPDLLTALYRVYTDLTETYTASEQHKLFLYEMNRMVMVALQTGLTYEEEHRKLYDLEHPTEVDTWLYTTESTELLNALYQRTKRQISNMDTSTAGQRRRFTSQGMADGQVEDFTDEQDIYESPQALWSVLKNQLVFLADHILSIERQRYLWSEGLTRSESSSKDPLAEHAEYGQVRTAVIQPLVEIGRVDAGFSLAEKYHGYAILVELIFDYEKNPNTRIEYYMDKFGTQFAFALYDYYVTKQRYYDFLKHGQAHPEMLNQYLTQSKELQGLAWLHDVYQERYTPASQKLLDISQYESYAQTRQTMVCLGKLAFLASIQPEQLELSSTMDTQAEFDDALDVFSVYQRLREQYEVSYNRVDDKVPKSTEEKGELIGQDLYASLKKSQPTFYHLVVYQLTRLLQGFTLSTEDLVELLTLKDHRDISQRRMDFGLALEVLRQSHALSDEARDYGIRMIWRQVCLHDHWDRIHKSLRRAGDEKLTNTLKDTTLYATLLFARQQGMPQEYFVCPTDAYFETTLQYFARRVKPYHVDKVTAEGLVHDHKEDNKVLNKYTGKCGLTSYYGEILRMVNTSIREVDGDEEE
ncbi:hypothetical protein IWQ61_003167, partial [Dispira simplex]